MSRHLSLTVLVLACACGRYIPPSPPTPRAATPVAAPFERTWNSVIDVFAQQVITIETMEKASGFIVASRSGIPNSSKADSVAGLAMADCGRIDVAFLGVPAAYLPTSAKYNVVVRPSGGASTVQVTTSFTRTTVKGLVECSSRGKFESNFEALVRARAEAP